MQPQKENIAPKPGKYGRLGIMSRFPEGKRTQVSCYLMCCVLGFRSRVTEDRRPTPSMSRIVPTPPSRSLTWFGLTGPGPMAPPAPRGPQSHQPRNDTTGGLGSYNPVTGLLAYLRSRFGGFWGEWFRGVSPHRT